MITVEEYNERMKRLNRYQEILHNPEFPDKITVKLDKGEDMDNLEIYLNTAIVKSFAGIRKALLEIINNEMGNLSVRVESEAEKILERAKKYRDGQK